MSQFISSLYSNAGERELRARRRQSRDELAVTASSLPLAGPPFPHVATGEDPIAFQGIGVEEHALGNSVNVVGAAPKHAIAK